MRGRRYDQGQQTVEKADFQYTSISFAPKIRSEI
jgi:hypothetical protein